MRQTNFDKEEKAEPMGIDLGFPKMTTKHLNKFFPVCDQETVSKMVAKLTSCGLTCEPKSSKRYPFGVATDEMTAKVLRRHGFAEAKVREAK